MSQHRSLRSSGTSAAKRNVLKRFERVEILKKRSQWKSGDRVTGLRKTKPDAWSSRIRRELGEASRLCRSFGAAGSFAAGNGRGGGWRIHRSA